MTPHLMRKYLVATATLTSLGLLATNADAGGLSTARFGGEHGHPTTFNPTAIYYNPAGIARSEGLNFFIDGNLAFRGVDYTHQLHASEQAEPPDALGANEGSASLFNLAAAPMIGTTAKFDISEAFDLALGLGWYVPFGGSSVWGQDDKWKDHPTQPGAIDGVNRWYSIHGTIRSFYWTGTAAVALFDRVYLGVSGNLVLSQIDSLRARNGDGSSNLVDIAGGGEGRSWLKASGWNGSLGAGVMVEAVPDELFIGASYQSQPGFGDMNLEGTLRNNFAGTESEDEVRMIQNMPDIVRLGLSWRAMQELELRLFGDYQRWSVLEQQCMVGKKTGSDEWDECLLNDDGSSQQNPDGTPKANVIQNLQRKWNDSFSIRAGVSYWPLEELELFGGVGYDSNAVPDETLDTALLDFHDVSVALGARVQFVDWLFGAISWTQLIYIPRDTTDSAGQHEFTGVSAGPNGGGEYSQWIGVLNVNLQAQFDLFGSGDDKEAAPPPPAPAPAEPEPEPVTPEPEPEPEPPPPEPEPEPETPDAPPAEAPDAPDAPTPTPEEPAPEPAPVP